MKTIILNGSPKGNSKKSNSRIFSEAFVKNMKDPCEIKPIFGNDPVKLAEYITEFDTVIIILPLYIHAMPGIVMKFIEELKPAASEGKYIGFIIQAGFIETAQHKYVKAYFENLAAQLCYNYLGTVTKGEAAGIYMYPKMFKKVIALVNDLGSVYEETHSFAPEITAKLSRPYDLSKPMLFLLRLVDALGLSNIGWHSVLRKNNAMDKRLDRPFLRN